MAAWFTQEFSTWGPRWQELFANEALTVMPRPSYYFPLTPPWSSQPNLTMLGDAVVETWFDSLEDLNALFFSENFQTKVDPDHANFLDLTQGGIIVCEELVVVEG